jgi:hypothetical protein
VTKDGQTKIYVAGSSKDLERAQGAFDVIRDIPGILLAFDWISLIIKNNGSANRNLPRDVRREIAALALNAAADADVFWLLCPTVDNLSFGVWAELGAFVTAHRRDPMPILSSGGDPEISIFSEVATSQFEYDWEAAGWIRGKWGHPRLLSQTDLAFGSGTPHGGF